MAVEATLRLSAAEKKQLAVILGCSAVEVEQVLGAYATAALEEYVRMFLGQRVFTRGSDILEYRLQLLIKTAFGGRLPDEQRVSALFQESASSSRALIRRVLAKYQYELSTEIETTMRETLGSVDENPDGWVFTVNSENVVDTMNRSLAVIDGSLPQVRKIRDTVSSYLLLPSSYLKLCERFGVTAKARTQA